MHVTVSPARCRFQHSVSPARCRFQHSGAARRRLAEKLMHVMQLAGRIDHGASVPFTIGANDPVLSRANAKSG